MSELTSSEKKDEKIIDKNIADEEEAIESYQNAKEELSTKEGRARAAEIQDDEREHKEELQDLKKSFKEMFGERRQAVYDKVNGVSYFEKAKKKQTGIVERPEPKGVHDTTPVTRGEPGHKTKAGIKREHDEEIKSMKEQAAELTETPLENLRQDEKDAMETLAALTQHMVGTFGSYMDPGKPNGTLTLTELIEKFDEYGDVLPKAEALVKDLVETRKKIMDYYRGTKIADETAKLELKYMEDENNEGGGINGLINALQELQEAREYLEEAKKTLFERENIEKPMLNTPDQELQEDRKNVADAEMALRTMQEQMDNVLGGLARDRKMEKRLTAAGVLAENRARLPKTPFRFIPRDLRNRLFRGTKNRQALTDAMGEHGYTPSELNQEIIDLDPARPTFNPMSRWIDPKDHRVMRYDDATHEPLGWKEMTGMYFGEDAKTVAPYSSRPHVRLDRMVPVLRDENNKPYVDYVERVRLPEMAFEEYDVDEDGYLKVDKFGHLIKKRKEGIYLDNNRKKDVTFKGKPTPEKDMVSSQTRDMAKKERFSPGRLRTYKIHHKHYIRPEEVDTSRKGLEYYRRAVVDKNGNHVKDADGNTKYEPVLNGWRYYSMSNVGKDFLKLTKFFPDHDMNVSRVINWMENDVLNRGKAASDDFWGKVLTKNNIFFDRGQLSAHSLDEMYQNGLYGPDGNPLTVNVTLPDGTTQQIALTKENITKFNDETGIVADAERQSKFYGMTPVDMMNAAQEAVILNEVFGEPIIIEDEPLPADVHINRLSGRETEAVRRKAILEAQKYAVAAMQETARRFNLDPSRIHILGQPNWGADGLEVPWISISGVDDTDQYVKMVKYYQNLFADGTVGNVDTKRLMGAYLKNIDDMTGDIDDAYKSLSYELDDVDANEKERKMSFVAEKMDKFWDDIFKRYNIPLNAYNAKPYLLGGGVYPKGWDAGPLEISWTESRENEDGTKTPIKRKATLDEKGVKALNKELQYKALEEYDELTKNDESRLRRSRIQGYLEWKFKEGLDTEIFKNYPNEVIASMRRFLSGRGWAEVKADELLSLFPKLPDYEQKKLIDAVRSERPDMSMAPDNEVLDNNKSLLEKAMRTRAPMWKLLPKGVLADMFFNLSENEQETIMRDVRTKLKADIPYLSGVVEAGVIRAWQNLPEERQEEELAKYVDYKAKMDQEEADRLEQKKLEYARADETDRRVMDAENRKKKIEFYKLRYDDWVSRGITLADKYGINLGEDAQERARNAFRLYKQYEDAVNADRELIEGEDYSAEEWTPRKKGLKELQSKNTQTMNAIMGELGPGILLGRPGGITFDKMAKSIRNGDERYIGAFSSLVKEFLTPENLSDLYSFYMTMAKNYPENSKPTIKKANKVSELFYLMYGNGTDITNAENILEALPMAFQNTAGYTDYSRTSPENSESGVFPTTTLMESKAQDTFDFLIGCLKDLSAGMLPAGDGESGSLLTKVYKMRADGKRMENKINEYEMRGGDNVRALREQNADVGDRDVMTTVEQDNRELLDNVVNRILGADKGILRTYMTSEELERDVYSDVDKLLDLQKRIMTDKTLPGLTPKNRRILNNMLQEMKRGKDWVYHNDETELVTPSVLEQNDNLQQEKEAAEKAEAERKAKEEAEAKAKAEAEKAEKERQRLASKEKKQKKYSQYDDTAADELLAGNRHATKRNLGRTKGSGPNSSERQAIKEAAKKRDHPDVEPADNTEQEIEGNEPEEVVIDANKKTASVGRSWNGVMVYTHEDVLTTPMKRMMFKKALKRGKTKQGIEWIQDDGGNIYMVTENGIMDERGNKYTIDSDGELTLDVDAVTSRNQKLANDENYARRHQDRTDVDFGPNHEYRIGTPIKGNASRRSAEISSGLGRRKQLDTLGDKRYTAAIERDVSPEALAQGKKKHPKAVDYANIDTYVPANTNETMSEDYGKPTRLQNKLINFMQEWETKDPEMFMKYRDYIESLRQNKEMDAMGDVFYGSPLQFMAEYFGIHKDPRKKLTIRELSDVAQLVNLAADKSFNPQHVRGRIRGSLGSIDNALAHYRNRVASETGKFIDNAHYDPIREYLKILSDESPNFPENVRNAIGRIVGAAYGGESADELEGLNDVIPKMRSKSGRTLIDAYKRGFLKPEYDMVNVENNKRLDREDAEREQAQKKQAQAEHSTEIKALNEETESLEPTTTAGKRLAQERVDQQNHKLKQQQEKEEKNKEIYGETDATVVKNPVEPKMDTEISDSGRYNKFKGML